MKSRIANRFSYEKVEGLKFDVKDKKSISRTQQHFANEVNINAIMKKAAKTGIIGNPLLANPSRVAKYGDFSEIGNFQELVNRTNEINADFAKLPADLRSRFDNDPAKLVDFVANPANLEEGVKLGIFDKALLPVVEEVVATPSVVVEPVVK